MLFYNSTDSSPVEECEDIIRIFPKQALHLNSYDLTDVLNALKYNWITINSLSRS